MIVPLHFPIRTKTQRSSFRFRPQVELLESRLVPVSTPITPSLFSTPVVPEQSFTATETRSLLTSSTALQASTGPLTAAVTNAAQVVQTLTVTNGTSTVSTSNVTEANLGSSNAIAFFPQFEVSALYSASPSSVTDGAISPQATTVIVASGTPEETVPETHTSTMAAPPPQATTLINAPDTSQEIVPEMHASAMAESATTTYSGVGSPKSTSANPQVAATAPSEPLAEETSASYSPSTTVIVAPDRPLAVKPELVTLIVASVPAAPSGGGFFAPSLGTPQTVEIPVVVNGISLGQVLAHMEGQPLSLASPQITGPTEQIISAWPATPTVDPIDFPPGAFADESPVTPYQDISVPVDVSGPGIDMKFLSLSTLTEDFATGNGNGAHSSGEKDVGLAQVAAQRKALALGLRYLYPNMTDDEIAKTAGVSRRTLFRWDEYMTLKRAQREVYKRPRGCKDKQGNIEAWTEEDE